MDETAKSILGAIDAGRGRFTKPVLIRLQGTNMEQGQRMMRKAGYKVYSDLEQALDHLKMLKAEIK